MVKELRVYFEGHSGLRPAFDQFFRVVKAKLPPNRFYLVTGRGRDQTIQDFLAALRDDVEAHNVLLLDSDRPDDGRCFERLREGRKRFPKCRDQVFWMVQLMEAWFLADREALRSFYGRGFREKALPANPDVEKIPKEDLLRRLKEATRSTKKGAYDKGAHAPRILERLDPTRVRKAAPNCERMFSILLKVLSS